jgi:hypothetical protein
VHGELDAVVGDAPLAVVVCADLLGAIAGADLRAPVGGELGLLLGERARLYERARSTRSAFSRFCSCDFSSCIDTTIPEGLCVTRTAESVVLTDCPPGPDER